MVLTSKWGRILQEIHCQCQIWLNCAAAGRRPANSHKRNYLLSVNTTDFEKTTIQAHSALHSWQRCPARPDGDISPEAILSTFFGSSRTATHRQVTCTCQIWISGWILPHFDVRTISVASKLKKLQIFLYYWQKIFDGTKLDSDGERSSDCECYLWRLIIPAHTLQHCTVGEYFD